MADSNTAAHLRASLRVEALESREVPTSFGVNRGLTVAFADILGGDAQNEYITATGPGRETLVRIWDLQGQELMRFNPFPGFSGGAYLATGDVDLDGTPELIVSTAPGTMGQVKVYAFRDGGRQELTTIVPFGPTYAGGVQIAAGDVTGDRAREIIVGRENGSSTVKVYAYDDSVQTAFEIRSFQAYGPNYHGGVTVAAASIDIRINSLTDPYNYNYAEIITGRSSELPQVRIFDAQNPTVTMRASYFAFNINNPAARQGINVAAGSTDARRGAEIYVGLRNGGSVRIFNGWNGGLLGAIRPYPNNYARSVNFFVHSNDDDFAQIHTIGDLIVVGANGPYEQVPIVFFGRPFSPAGLNGSRPAA
jgi:hypothetical protein